MPFVPIDDAIAFAIDAALKSSDIRQLDQNADDHELRIVALEGKLSNFTAGDYNIQQNIPVRSTSATSYTKLKEIKLEKGGTIRAKFSIYANDSGAWVYGRVYRNGAAVGSPTGGVNSTTPVEFSEDISGWTAGDLYQVYGYANVGTNTVYIENQKVCVGAPGTTPGSHESY